VLHLLLEHSDYPPTKFIELWNQGLIGQKEYKKKLIFFFKEEDQLKKQSPSKAISPPFEVNLVNNQDFVCSQYKVNVNLP
jgi:hypothetical protein